MQGIAASATDGGLQRQAGAAKRRKVALDGAPLTPSRWASQAALTGAGARRRISSVRACSRSVRLTALSGAGPAWQAQAQAQAQAVAGSGAAGREGRRR